jgi:tetratricopeptide (TPR) repeat protein
MACLGLAGDEKELRSTKTALQEIVNDTPDFLTGHVSLGDALRRLGAPLEASSVWEEGYRSLGRGVFLERLEALFLDEGDPATLLSFYRDFVREKGNDLMLRFFYGKLCLRLEMIEEGLEQLQLVESSGVDYPQIHLLLAEAHSRRGRLDVAIQQYKKALGVTSRLAIGYVCDTCNEESSEWQSRCSACGEWASLSVVGRQSLHKAMTATTHLREIHHGEREAWGTE